MAAYDCSQPMTTSATAPTGIKCEFNILVKDSKAANYFFS